MRTLILFFIFCFPLLLQAQIIFGPIQSDPVRKKYMENKPAFRTAALNDTLELPFFDDFSFSRIEPADSLWMPGGGTYVNNDFAIAPPTFNVLTFDGMKANGEPYSTVKNKSGAADHITSRPIDLSDHIPSDSVILSFFWQEAGLGNRPWQEDNIALEFLDADSIWQEVWIRHGADRDNSTFFLQYIPLENEAFFHNAFQFRFRSHGDLDGPWSIWNIDYIFLDSGRISDGSFEDNAIQEFPGSVLKDYTSVPYEHFKNNVSGFLKDELQVKVNNLQNDQQIPGMEAAAFIKETGDTVYHSPVINVTSPIAPFQKRDFIIPLDRSALQDLEEDRTIGIKYILTSNDDNEVQMHNDTAVAWTFLDDYYAYDDGGAEAYLGIKDITGGSIAVRFDLPQQDTLKGINIYFHRYLRDLSGELFSLKIWDENMEVIHQETADIHYEHYNTYHFYEFNTGIELPPGKFYAGFSTLQGRDYYITIGYDVNTGNTDKIKKFYEGEWLDHESSTGTRGSAMMRPVFGDAKLLFVKKPDKPVKALNATAFPNPTSGRLTLQGNIENVKVMDLTGRTLKEQTYSSFDETNDLDLSSLREGTYILYLENSKNEKTTKRIVIRR